MLYSMLQPMRQPMPCVLSRNIPVHRFDKMSHLKKSFLPCINTFFCCHNIRKMAPNLQAESSYRSCKWTAKNACAAIVI